MTNAALAPASVRVSNATPIALHYVRKDLIGTTQTAVALCGESGAVATAPAAASAGATSYTCPDCMLRYSLLTGGATNV